MFLRSVYFGFQQHVFYFAWTTHSHRELCEAQIRGKSLHCCTLNMQSEWTQTAVLRVDLYVQFIMEEMEEEYFVLLLLTFISILVTVNLSHKGRKPHCFWQILQEYVYAARSICFVLCPDHHSHSCPEEVDLLQVSVAMEGHLFSGLSLACTKLSNLLPWLILLSFKVLFAFFIHFYWKRYWCIF